MNELLKSYPESSKIRDKESELLPLFIAVRNPKVSIGVIRSLIKAYPDGASTLCYDSYALHHLAQKGTPNYDVIKLVYDAFPNAIYHPNLYGNLPLHFLCSSEKPNVELTRMIMYAYPLAVTYRNKLGETPIERAMNKKWENNEEEMNLRIRLLLRLAEPSMLSDKEFRLLKELNWQARKVIILVCVQLSKKGENHDKRLLELMQTCDGVWRFIIAWL